MKVLHVITGLGDGGAEGALYRLVRADVRASPVVVSLVDHGKYGSLLEELGVRVHALNMRRGQFSWKGLLALAQIVRRERPDLVQTWMYHADLFGGLAAWANRTPVVWGIRNSVLLGPGSSASTRVVARLCAVLSWFIPCRIISCSRRGAVEHARLGYAKSKIVVVPNGYDLRQFAPDQDSGRSFRSELGIGDGAFLLGLVARWHPDKNHRVLLDALALVGHDFPQLHAVFVGTDCEPNNMELASLVAAGELSERIHLLGRRTDIPRIMNGLDAHVLASSTEAFPNVLAEAMATGTVCVATDVGDAAAIVGAAGWIVPPEDPKALAGAIREVLALKAKAAAWTTLKRNARMRVEAEFSLDRMVAEFRSVWISALTGPRR